jgi:molecular chaperone GrpE (heat shock protein)
MTFESEKTGIPPEEEPVTSRDEAGEPSGEEDPANEQQGMEDKEAASEEPEASEQPEDYLALAQRIQADFENYRKRAASAHSSPHRKANSTSRRESGWCTRS